MSNGFTESQFEKLNNIYYNTKTGFSGINDIARKSEENVKFVKQFSKYLLFALTYLFDICDKAPLIPSK